MSDFRKRSKKRKEREDLRGNWLTTYGDMVTLLLTFFVFLYSFSVIDAHKFEKMMHSFQSTIGVLPAGTAILGEETFSGGRFILPNQRLLLISQESKETYEKIANFLKAEIQAGEVAVRIEERGVVISILDSILFDSGKIDIHPKAKRLLYKISQIIKDIPNYISVEGHTDNVPLKGGPYVNNLGLSAMRAAAVSSYLTRAGIEPERIRAVGYGQSRPLVPNDTEEHKRINRRVDILINNL